MDSSTSTLRQPPRSDHRHTSSVTVTTRTTTAADDDDDDDDASNPVQPPQPYLIPMGTITYESTSSRTRASTSILTSVYDTDTGKSRSRSPPPSPPRSPPRSTDHSTGTRAGTQAPPPPSRRPRPRRRDHTSPTRHQQPSTRVHVQTTSYHLPSSSSPSPPYPTFAAASTSASASASLPPGASYAPFVPLCQPVPTLSPALPPSLVPGAPVRSASLPVTTTSADPAETSTRPAVSGRNLSLSTIPQVFTSPLGTDAPTAAKVDPFTSPRSPLPPPITTATTTTTTTSAVEQPSGSMAGVGRSSVLRNAPLLGPAPTSASSPAASPTIALPLPFSASTSAPLDFIDPPRPVAALPPPHLIPQPEVCVECMMRDKDMDDVDVTGPHVWDRDSDIDFEDALRWDDEIAATMTNSDHHKTGAGAGGSEESGSLGAHGSINGIRRTAGGSRESATGPSSYGHALSGGGASSIMTRKRIGRGHPLTTAALKLWTSMNPPASAHRWRTLQTYLATQVHFNELHRQKREAQQQQLHREIRSEHYEGDSYQLPVLNSAGSALAATLSSPTAAGPATFGPRHHQPRSSSPWRGSAHLPLDAMDERISRAQGPNQSRTSLQNEPTSSSAPLTNAYDHRNSSMSIPTSTPSLPTLQPSPASASVRNYAHGDQPWLSNPLRRSSNPILSTSVAMTNGGSASPNLRDRASTLTTPSPSTGFTSFANKFGRSSTDLRSISSRPNSTRATPRDGTDGGSPPPQFGHPPSSPGRAPSFLYPQDDRSSLHTNRRVSTWSKFRQSASQSVLSFAPSFAPSGSMVEMHLGLEADRYQHAQHGLANYQHHHGRSGFLSSTISNHPTGGGHHPYLNPGYPSMSDSYVARHPNIGNEACTYVNDGLLHRDEEGELLRGKKLSEKESGLAKKKKGLKGFFSKLVGGGGNDKKQQQASSVPPAPARGDLFPRHQSDSQVPTRSNGYAGPRPVYGFYDTTMDSLPTSEELAPPPPLSTLTKVPNARRFCPPSMNSLSKTRSASTSSIDSLRGVPYTPPLIAPIGPPPMNGYRPSSVVVNSSDRRSIKSYTSSNRSKFLPPPISTTQRNSYNVNGNGTNHPNSNPTLISPTSGQSWSLRSTDEVIFDPTTRATPTQKSLPHLPQPTPPTTPSAKEPHNRSSSSSSLIETCYAPPIPSTSSTNNPTSLLYDTENFTRSTRSLFSSSSKSQPPLGTTTAFEEEGSKKKTKTRSRLFHFDFGSSTGSKHANHSNTNPTTREMSSSTLNSNDDFEPGEGEGKGLSFRVRGG
ncbi:hypothetical protein MVLG_02052 [Microbotryum lychnidis-dioicae p1A1 Lamole]|uniref:Uncharacterized protein n=1 Tax=Microbotryum lychnidis-dioicae (strain p1A1 Lamole / MvSl-1064) TaxID=683840 RepID=U5H401_USTV1|nr:hypothetical protein MVLG_02052 [Microbotryum lychnidis-dioicae p1A1 Lamole]|eukprot:KDE07784.1 hypothetical protein MVLG_02052 [Microbotryum lychnidis-dioicae p1A1 Lamole]